MADRLLPITRAESGPRTSEIVRCGRSRPATVLVPTKEETIWDAGESVQQFIRAKMHEGSVEVLRNKTGSKMDNAISFKHPYCGGRSR